MPCASAPPAQPCGAPPRRAAPSWTRARQPARRGPPRRRRLRMARAQRISRPLTTRFTARTHPPSWAARRPTSHRRRRRRPQPPPQPAHRPAQPAAVRVALTQPWRSTQRKTTQMRIAWVSQSACCVRVRQFGRRCGRTSSESESSEAAAASSSLPSSSEPPPSSLNAPSRNSSTPMSAARRFLAAKAASASAAARAEAAAGFASAHTRAGTRDAAATRADALQAACRAQARHAVARSPRKAAEAGGGCAYRDKRRKQDAPRLGSRCERLARHTPVSAPFASRFLPLCTACFALIFMCLFFLRASSTPGSCFCVNLSVARVSPFLAPMAAGLRPPKRPGGRGG